MSVAGTFSVATWVVAVIAGSSEFVGLRGQVVVNQYLALWGPAPFDCLIGGVQARAETAGSGAGSTVLDILVDGASIWSNAADRPTLAAVSTGNFTSSAPPSRRAVTRGQRVDIQVVTVPATTGHALVRCGVAIERAHTT